MTRSRRTKTVPRTKVDDQKKAEKIADEIGAGEVPPSIPVATKTLSPIATVEDGDEKGETQAPIRHPDGRPAGIPTTVHTRKTAEQQLREAQCRQKPCASCSFAEFPGPHTPHRIEIERQLRKAQTPRERGGLGIWQGLSADDFIWCDEDPETTKTLADGSVQKSGGPGGKFLGYNCPEWHRRQEDLVPDWVPGPIAKLVHEISVVGDRLRQRGVMGYLRAMHADYRRRNGGHR